MSKKDKDPYLNKKHFRIFLHFPGGYGIPLALNEKDTEFKPINFANNFIYNLLGDKYRAMIQEIASSKPYITDINIDLEELKNVSYNITKENMHISNISVSYIIGKQYCATITFDDSSCFSISFANSSSGFRPSNPLANLIYDSIGEDYRIEIQDAINKCSENINSHYVFPSVCIA